MLNRKYVRELNNLYNLTQSSCIQLINYDITYSTHTVLAELDLAINDSNNRVITGIVAKSTLAVTKKCLKS